MRLLSLIALLCVGCRVAAPNQESVAWSRRMADSMLARYPSAASIEKLNNDSPPKWSYSTAILVYAIAQIDDARYLKYAHQYMETFVNARGEIVTPTYNPDAYKLDDVAPGRLLLWLHHRTHDDRWLTAAHELAQQLRHQPRNSDGGFWHKQIYPHQMWLDGIYMACPFMSEYARITGERQWSDEAARQITLIAHHTRDASTGLYRHGFDESRAEAWADPKTGQSQCVWGRAGGWFIMGIVDTLEQLPEDHPRRDELLALLRQLADAIARAQDSSSGVWHQVLDQPRRRGNYLESSSSCMFVYALSKSVRLGYIPRRYRTVAENAYRGIISQFIAADPQSGLLSLTHTCQVAGLGGKPYRDGSFEYYISEPAVDNDPKGVAAFILASLEIEQLSRLTR